MQLDGGGGGSEAEAPYTFQDAEPTVHEFVPGKPEQATRYLYVADASQVGFSLVVGSEALKNPGLISTVAGQWANTWNLNAAVPGVQDIGEDQAVRPLGSLEDVVNVAVSSTSGRSSGIITLTQSQVRPDDFAAEVAAFRKVLDANEESGG